MLNDAMIQATIQGTDATLVLESRDGTYQLACLHTDDGHVMGRCWRLHGEWRGSVDWTLPGNDRVRHLQTRDLLPHAPEGEAMVSAWVAERFLRMARVLLASES
jgi:hypothetical protein